MSRSAGKWPRIAAISSLLLAFVLVLPIGCASTQPRSDAPADASSATEPSADSPPRCQIWLDVYRGEPVPYDTILPDLSESDVIYVGERHTIARHHEIETRIVSDLAADGVPLVLGIEQMEAPYQPILDEYARGEIDFATLAERTDWKHRWSNYADYEPALEAARAAHAPILALNARQEVVRAVFRKGIDGLDAEMRAELPKKILLDDPVYAGLLREVMMVHAAADESMMHRMFEAQVARDETMAARLADFLKSPEGEGRTAVVLCGAGHCSYGLGVPARVRLRLPDVRDRIIVLSESGDVVLSPQERAAMRDIEITHQQLRQVTTPIADYLEVAQLRETDQDAR